MEKIDKKITQYKVVSPSDKVEVPIVELSHIGIPRPDYLPGATYKIKTPKSEHAMYITINDITLNVGTKSERMVPFEIFINSKNMDHFQWVIAITRVISAIFRMGGDYKFLVEELKSVFDPTGGYYKRGGKYMNSMVAEIGEVIETHLKTLDALNKK